MNQDYQNHKILCENQLYITLLIIISMISKYVSCKLSENGQDMIFFVGQTYTFQWKTAKQNHILASRTKEKTGTSAEILIQCKQVFVASLNEHINKLYR